MATTCFIARSAENTVSGAFSAMARGGRLACSANTMQIATNKNEMASRSIVRRFIAGKICYRYRESHNQSVQTVAAIESTACSQRIHQRPSISQSCELNPSSKQLSHISLFDSHFTYGDLAFLRV